MRTNLAFFSRGFTLVEVMVVISIISILSSVVYFSFEGAREKSRDAKRITDVEQIALAMRLYAEYYRGDDYETFDCAAGVKIDGAATPVSLTASTQTCSGATAILTYLDEYFSGQIPHDPKGPGDDDYFYYFDGSHTCDAGGNVPLVFAANMETSQSNATDVCTSVGGNDGGYMRTDLYAGTISTSQPYVRRVVNTLRQ